LALLAAVAGLVLHAGCRRPVQRTNEVVSVPAAKVPLDPGDSAWAKAPENAAKLLLQDLVEPRLMRPSTTEVLVRSLNNGVEIGFRLEWVDSSPDDLADAGRFPDACAVQIPQRISAIPPEPQMGQAGQPVEITFWRADWQAFVNGRPDTIQSLYPNATIDHYPFEAKPLEPGSVAQKEMSARYAPAQAVGNRRVGPRTSPVEDMIAEGPGTLGPAKGGSSRGQGSRTKDGWSVVLLRRLPEGIAPGVRSQIAIAVWEGSHQEVGARKMRTGWIPLSVRAAQ